MPDLGDLVGANPVQQRVQRGRITRAYAEGLDIGMQEETRAQIEAMRQAQVRLLLQKHRKAAALAPKFGEYASALMESDYKSPEWKEAASEIYAADETGDILNDITDNRTMLEVAEKRLLDMSANDRIITEIQARQMVEAAKDAAPGLEFDPNNLVGLPMGFGRSMLEKGAAGQREEFKQGQLNLRQAERLAARKPLDDAKRLLTDAQRLKIEGDIARAEEKRLRGGYDTAGEFVKDFQPTFRTIMTKGKTARRQSEEEEKAIAEIAALRAWKFITKNGVDVETAIGLTITSLDIKPTERGFLRTERTDLGAAIEQLEGRAADEAAAKKREGDIKGAVDAMKRELLDALKENKPEE